jgi:hypothetical protein
VGNVERATSALLMNPYDIEYWRRVDQCRVSQTYLEHTLNGGFKDLRRRDVRVVVVSKARRG